MRGVMRRWRGADALDVPADDTGGGWEMIFIQFEDEAEQYRKVRKYCRESRFQQIRRNTPAAKQEKKRQMLAGVVAMATVMFLCLAGLAVLVWL